MTWYYLTTVTTQYLNLLPIESVSMYLVISARLSAEHIAPEWYCSFLVIWLAWVDRVWHVPQF